MCTWWILLILQLFKIIGSYRLYSVVDILSDTNYDCIYAYNDPEFYNNAFEPGRTYVPNLAVEQIQPFCLVVEHSSMDESFCHSSNSLSWSFGQLREDGVKSSDLALWNAPVNIIDEYEYYLLTNREQLNRLRFCNCTDRIHFGAQCQYTFDLQYESFELLLSAHFSNLPERSVEEAVMMEDADFTCYIRDALCTGGCLDWRQICNGIVDCTHEEDEASCNLLEFNECRGDEYRCRSGYCIPITFAFDGLPDCVDGSDEIASLHSDGRLEGCSHQIPHTFCDDYNAAWMMFPCGDGTIVENPHLSCDNQRYIRTLKQWYFADRTLCWQYVTCAQGFDILFPSLLNCSELCGKNDDCWSMILLMCPNSTVFVPPNPVMLSPSVYLAYRTNISKDHYVPDFLCYTQCDHLYPPSLRLHGYSCRSFQEFTSPPFHKPVVVEDIFSSIYSLFAGCVNKSTTNRLSAIFNCPLANFAISSHRIKDAYKDCYLGLDEDFNGSVCALNLTQRFQCWTSSTECIHVRYVQDGGKRCSDHSDEAYPQDCIYGTEQICDYRRGLYRPAIAHYQFRNLCNGKESKPSLLSLLNGTDETDCEDAWCPLTAWSRCDDYWDCADGHDELNCSSKRPTLRKSASIALHKMNNCSMSEHFCLPIAYLPGDAPRSCIAKSRSGDGQIDCWGATDERLRFCNYTTYIMEHEYRYPCAGVSGSCIALRQICDGRADCPLADDEKICHWQPVTTASTLFYCRSGKTIGRNKHCNGQIDCDHGEDEWFCDLDRSRSHIYLEGVFQEDEFPVYPVNVMSASPTHAHNFQAISSTLPLMTSDWYCNRGMPIKNLHRRRCLCPPSYRGERCEIQQSRVSLLLQIISPSSFQVNSALKMIVYLIDVASSEILVEEEILHLPYVHSSYKQIVSLPSARANSSFVRIDAYEVQPQRIIGHRMSWKFSLPFSFLPVRRLPVKLFIPDEENFASRMGFSCPSCIHGECLSYQNSDDVFCRCHNGWVDRNCNTSLTCALGAHSLSSHRCLCPMERHGTRCFVPNMNKCRCQNSATCIQLDARVGHTACLCSDNFFGKYCEKVHANLTIQLNSVYHPKVLPVVLVQFVAVGKHSDMDFENVFLFERLSSSQPLVVHHVGYEELPLMVLCKIFYSSSSDHYAYYLVLYKRYSRAYSTVYPTSVLTQLDPKQRCTHVREMEMFKSPVNIFVYPHIKRIKSYFRACTENNTRCFHDEVYFCFCSNDRKEIPNCITYDHTHEACKEPNYCLNGGLCIENRRKGAIEFSCLCPECLYYGSLCQFTISSQGLSLDALVGIEMRTGKSLVEQPILIKASMVILICMNLIGFVGNFLSILTLSRKKSRESGCGWYLLLLSISNQCTVLVFALRFVYLLVTQIIILNSRKQSLILCQSLELSLIVLSNLSNWLSVCVSVERTFTVARGLSFNKTSSLRTAKGLCVILPIVLIATAIHEPMTRDLIEDPRLQRYTWCVTKFHSETIKTVTRFFTILHLLGPFLINLIATGLLIFIISRQKLTVRKGVARQTFSIVLREQISNYRHLIIGPVILMIFALPRLVISLGSLCISTSWRNYVFLAGYFISYVPCMATLLIFILPAPLYHDELKLCLLQFRHFFVRQSPRRVIYKK